MSFLPFCFQKNTNKPFFVAFKYRKVKDGDDNMEGVEMWPVIARAVREQPVNVLAVVGGRTGNRGVARHCLGQGGQQQEGKGQGQ